MLNFFLYMFFLDVCENSGAHRRDVWKEKAFEIDYLEIEVND